MNTPENDSKRKYLTRSTIFIVFIIIFVGSVIFIITNSLSSNREKTDSTTTNVIDVSDIISYDQLTRSSDDNQTKVAEFTVEDQEFNKPYKAVFEIRVQDRISEDSILSIASDLRNNYPGFQKYFISFWLPGMEIGSGAWATCHFTPELELNVTGLSKQDASSMASNLPKSEKVIGRWVWEILEGVILTIYESNGQYQMQSDHQDGSSGTEKLSRKGNIFSDENDFGEFYKIEPDGRLGMYSRNGRYQLLEKL